MAYIAIITDSIGRKLYTSGLHETPAMAAAQAFRARPRASRCSTSTESGGDIRWHYPTDFDAIMAKHGFTEWQTGGGCTAYGKRVDPANSHSYVLITDADGGSVPTHVCQHMMVGYYDAEGEGDVKEVASLGEALEAAEDYLTAANHS